MVDKSKASAWLKLRFTLWNSDPWDCLIGGYATLIEVFGLSEDEAFSMIKCTIEEYWGPDGIQRQADTRSLLYGSSCGPEVCKP